MEKCQYDFGITGIPIRWKTPFPLELDERYGAFLTDIGEKPEIIWNIRVGVPRRDRKAEEVIYEGEWCQITTDEKYQYRTFSYSSVQKERVVTLIRPLTNKDYYNLYIPEGSEEEFKRAKNWSFYMALEEVLYSRGRFLLHASYVDTEDGALLFTGPSGIGKSTQAALWEQYGGGKIQNGDRAALYEEDGRIIASGSPYAGSSGVYRNHQSRVRAILVLEQGEENRLRRLKGREGLLPLLRESSFSYMDGEMKIHQTELFIRVMETVPVYHYCCRKDRSAVYTLKEELERISCGKQCSDTL